MDTARTVVRKGMRVVAKAIDSISGSRITPNMITCAGLIGHFGIAYLIVLNQYTWAAVLLVAIGLFDTLDGELARLQKRESSFGMFFDSVSDRVKEVVLYVAVGYSLTYSGEDIYGAVWAIAACGSALLVSYTNAWGEAVLANSKLRSSNHQPNKTLRVGFMSFEIRMLSVVVGLATNQLLLALVFITVGSVFTSLVRTWNFKQRLAMHVQD